MKILFVVILLMMFNFNEDRLVTCTVYNAVPGQTDDSPDRTSTMFKLDLKNPYKHRIIAVSRDLLEIFPYHSKVRIEGTKYDGIYVIEDTMNKRYKNRIDILINSEMRIGMWNNVKISKINE